MKALYQELYYWVAMFAYAKATGDLTPYRDYFSYVREVFKNKG